MMTLESFHEQLGARFSDDSDGKRIDHYGDPYAEYRALGEGAGVIDLSRRSRICLIGPDRKRLLNGQVTNEIQSLNTGDGCYAALVTAKGRIESDLNIYILKDEILLDFEPGLTKRVSARFEKFIIADDVEVVDVAPHYGMVSIQGPRASELVHVLGAEFQIPLHPMASIQISSEAWGEIYCINHPRAASPGADLFIPNAALQAVAVALSSATHPTGGRFCGEQALEMHRIEAGIPRFGQDMDENHLAPETGIESRAISYSKGCYIGQEVIARIRTYGQVKRSLCGFRLPDDLKSLPVHGDKLFHDGRESGHITSALKSLRFGKGIALGYARREVNQPGTELTLVSDGGGGTVRIVALPFSEADLT